jgi:nucleoside-diphosphate-sugar epimerase
MASWVVVGAGYTGGRLAERLRREGHEVVATRRTTLDLTRGTDLKFVGATIACLAPPGPDPAREIATLVGLGGRRVVYVSSTGVYAPGGGAWVDESWPLAPVTASGRARLVAEAALPATAAILRAAGIHGPGRGLVERIRAGSYRVVGDGRAHVSRIHVDDLIEAILGAGASDATGPFNVADDDPAPIGEVADAVAAHFGLPPPPRVPASAVDPEARGMLTADRRIANGRMKRELGVVLRWPSWRAALA